ncbi:N-acetylmuramoyl-L-alanine amidase [Paenibacillus sp. HJGM_3]|uniref:N-acetylmuramoyl-L-alanine amidase n=1 Tax=Paenibacillus sp. HJGM_3 TaxID=3379816 RepID=UPI00385D89C8
MKDWKWLLPLVMLLVALLLPATTEAASPVQLFLNGKKLEPEVPPRIVNDLTIVPLRIISEEVGARVSWIPEGSRIKVEQGTTAIELQIGNPVVTLNGVEKKLDVAPENVEGNTIVPVRFFSESFGLKVGYDDLTRSVSLYKQPDAGSTAGGSGTNGSTNGSGSGSTSGAAPGTNTGASNGNGYGSGSGTTTGGTSGNGASGSSGGSTGTGKPTGAGTDGKGTTGSGSPGSSGSGAGSGTTGTGAKPGSTLTFSKLELAGDEVVIQTTSAVAPKVSFLSSPERMVIDLPGVTLAGTPLAALNPKGGEIAVKHPVLQKIRYAQFSDKPLVARIVLDLGQKMDFKLTEDKSTNTYRIQLVKKRIKVVIDAGHGGSDPGAISLNSRSEKDFTLAMESKVVDHLKLIPDLDVYETRAGDTYPSLQERVDFANGMNANLFLSIHANKFDNPSVNGTETYYNRPDSIAFANLLHDKLMPVTGLGDRGVKLGDFKVIRETTMPAVLLEMGFLSNKNDEALLFSSEFQDRAAATIAAAIKEYLLGK